MWCSSVEFEYLLPIVSLAYGISLAHGISLECTLEYYTGTDLISPDDLLTSCKLLSKLKLKMSLRKLKSGVLVVRLDSHSEQAISKRLLEFVKTNNFVSPATLASKWRVSVVIAKEYLQVAEQDGSLCRDESQEGVRFWANRFLGK